MKIAAYTYKGKNKKKHIAAYTENNRHNTLLHIQRKTGKKNAVSVDRTRDLQIFSLTLSQLSYPRNCISARFNCRPEVISFPLSSTRTPRTMPHRNKSNPDLFTRNRTGPFQYAPLTRRVGPAPTDIGRNIHWFMKLASWPPPTHGTTRWTSLSLRSLQLWCSSGLPASPQSSLSIATPIIHLVEFGRESADLS